MSLGRISGGYGWEKNERVSKSSCGMLGAVKFENDFAADFNALSEAVKLDLNADFCLTARFGLCGNVWFILEKVSVEVGVCRGWLSRQLSAGGDDTTFSVRIAKCLRLRYDGVCGALKLDTVLCAASSDGANDGVVEAMLSLDTDREDNKAGSFSSSNPASRLSSSLSVSSAGSSSTSSGDLYPSDDERQSSCLHSWINSSIDIRLCCEGRRRFMRLGGGIEVTANKAATAGGNAFGSCFSLNSRPVLHPC